MLLRLLRLLRVVGQNDSNIRIGTLRTTEMLLIMCVSALLSVILNSKGTHLVRECHIEYMGAVDAFVF